MWIRLDDGFADHKKFFDDPLHGAICQLIQIRALCWAAHYLTDGHLPAHIISKFLAGLDNVGITNGMQGYDVKEIDWTERMVEARLWDKTSSGYRIHDYLDYNPSKKEYLEGLEKKRKSGQAGGQASAQARAQANAEPHAQAKSKRNPTSYPYPSPSQEREEKEVKSNPRFPVLSTTTSRMEDRETKGFELPTSGLAEFFKRKAEETPT